MGNEIKKLERMIPKNKKTALIMNALDYSKDLEERKKRDSEISENSQTSA